MTPQSRPRYTACTEDRESSYRIGRPVGQGLPDRRYAIVSDSDMREGAAKLARLHGNAPNSRHIDAHQRVFEA